jgi:hypothetical protein
MSNRTENFRRGHETDDEVLSAEDAERMRLAVEAVEKTRAKKTHRF